jgi:hypothetical protein
MQVPVGIAGRKRGAPRGSELGHMLLHFQGYTFFTTYMYNLCLTIAVVWEELTM